MGRLLFCCRDSLYDAANPPIPVEAGEAERVGAPTIGQRR
jgi:hypothetical protein